MFHRCGEKKMCKGKASIIDQLMVNPVESAWMGSNSSSTVC